MKRQIVIALLIFLGGHKASQAAFFHDPDLSWRTAQTEHFLIHFHNGEESLLPRVASIAESANQRITRFFDWQPEQKTHLILTDRMDFSNAFAMPIPRNTMVIIVTPPDNTQITGDYHDWLDLVIHHEYAHIVHIDKASGLPKGGRNIFGRIPFFFPNALQPLWVLEGLASYIESTLEDGIGRGVNSTYHSLMRLEVDSGIKPLSQVNLPIISWPGGTTRYLYGVYFFNFLRDTYGDEQTRRWINNYSDNLIPFMVNSTSRMVFGKNMNQLWDEFTQYLKNKFEPEIQRIRESALIEGQQITQDSYYSGFPRSTPNGDLLYVRNDWLNEPQLMLLPEGRPPARAIAPMHSTSYDVHPDAGVLVAEIDNYKNLNYFSDLYRIDISSGERTRLTTGQRYRQAVWSPDAKNIVAVRSSEGNTSLDLLDAQGAYQKTLWQGSRKEVISTVDWHPMENRLVAAVWRPGTRWNLETFNLDTLDWNTLTNTAGAESQPQYTADGQSVIFNADYAGPENLYRLDIKSGVITQLTSVMGGVISSTMLADGSGYYYTGQHNNGQDVFFLAADNALNKTANPTPLLATGIKADPEQNPQALESATEYSAIDYIYPTAWLPVFAITDDTSEFGITTFGTDPLNWHNYSLVAAYDVENNWALGSIQYTYDRWRVAFKLFTARDVLIVKNSANEINSFRNSDIATLEAVLPFFEYDRQWSLHAGISMEHKSDREVVSGGIPLRSTQDDLLGVALTYNSARRFPRGISLQDGVKWRFVAEDSDQLDSDYTGQVYTVDWRGFLELSGKHVLATRLVSATSTDNPNPFRLGGVNDGIFLAAPAATILEPTSLVFNKREYALRGYDDGLPQLTGSHMALAEVEWRFPVALIESSVMVPPIGINQLYGTLFYSAGDAWYDDFESAHYYESAGLELNGELIFGYFIPLNVKIGYAHGFDDIGEDTYYLQIGLSF